MECVLSGNQIKSLNRAVNCLYRVGSELLIEVLPDKVSVCALLLFLLQFGFWYYFKLQNEFNRESGCELTFLNGLQLSLRTLNTAWSAFLSVTFKGQFFDAFRVHTPNLACSVLLKVIHPIKFDHLLVYVGCFLPCLGI